MTCAYCKYDFCWACGKSASSEDNHWSMGGNGCGVGMMEVGIRPGDHLRWNGWNLRLKRFAKGLGWFILGCILYIPWLIFICPILCALMCYENTYRTNGKCASFFLAIVGFCGGLVLDICFIPAALLGTLFLLIAVICFLLNKLFKFVFRSSRQVTVTNPNQEASDRNMREA